MASGLAESESDQAEEFNEQFTDVFTQSRFNEAPLLDRSAPRMNDITVSTEGFTKAMSPDELHSRILKELATEVGPVFFTSVSAVMDTWKILKEWTLANICP